MFFKNFKNKLLLILFLATLIIPISAYAYSEEVILGGENVGIEVNSSGVLIVGFYDVKGTSPGREAGLKIGDVITAIDGKTISTMDELNEVKNTHNIGDEVKLKIYRNGSEKEAI